MIQNRDAHLFNNGAVAAPLTGIWTTQAELKCDGFRETMIQGERMHRMSGGDYR